MRHILLAACLSLASFAASADTIAPRDGWVVIETGKSHADLLAALKTAVKANKMGVVTQAGPTATAAKRGITIPENRVVGVFNNDFAVRILGLSTAAMIAAPIRFYVTEKSDGTATLSYKTPSFVFQPYMEEAGPDLGNMAEELDARFAAIAKAATQ
ncbi:MAG: DUF302 domain-containing protein [Arenibacterium sp.]